METTKLRVQRLFQQNTVDSMRLKEQNLRKEIEAKKEELRVLIGHRYRDLIDSADSIIHMRDCAQRVVEVVRAMEAEAVGLKPHMRAIAAREEEQLKSLKEEQEDIDFVFRVKVLVDTPEKIWDALECHNYFKATSLYLYAESLYAHLTVTPKNAALVGSMPLMQRQWSTLEQFPAKIKAGSTTRLQTSSLASMDYASALCSLHLLDSLPHTDVLSVFLAHRTSALRQMLDAKVQGSNSSGEASTPDTHQDAQECFVAAARHVIDTVWHILAIFHPAPAGIELAAPVPEHHRQATMHTRAFSQAGSSAKPHDGARAPLTAPLFTLLLACRTHSFADNSPTHGQALSPSLSPSLSPLPPVCERSVFFQQAHAHVMQGCGKHSRAARPARIPPHWRGMAAPCASTPNQLSCTTFGRPCTHEEDRAQWL
eukprot:CAMPEP_0177644538 /NCGR_PEP_ID=MMETSP0447-20121125/8743_1 /TAXON_ID=0 /ORGANISM="Stygamoeba regulata, Strain BSH-02190019" /LENGTH=425 /DNA_ID=CAMNT_0019146909 /DNA_START=112 /DNA_END=1389 /DNA_ORIENTATION=+